MCAKRLLMVSMMLTLIFNVAATAAEVTVDIRVVKSETYFAGTQDVLCKVSGETTNRTPTTIESFTVRLQFYDTDNQFIGTGDWIYENMRPKKTMITQAYVKSVTCEEIGKVVLDSVPFCKINGLYRKGCESLLKVAGGSKFAVEL